ncbi:MAG: DNA mismatch repair protein MutS, partial [Cytophagales bacterium]
KTGISSLKVAYNKVFGYYLEVTHAHRDKVPADWVRKQTLTNAERYITAELKHYEERILHAQERIGVLEYQLYQELVQDVAHAVPQIQQNAKMIGYIDCYQSFAHIAHKYGYTRPVLHNGHAIEITEGRHPVIERCLPPGHTYVSNDVLLNEQQQILLVTGPNMAGKSALLRQVALIVIMAHIGSFVPAKKAVISISDKIFVQMVPPDNIGRGESTFMREMTQMASFLNNLGPKSLVVVDELGRGTGTSDGLALAQSIIEYLHDHPRFRVKTLFSTHYHQLNKLADHLPRLKNFKVIVKEMGDRILFLHELRPGGSQHSFGIQVAKMAGVPTSVIDYAQQLIKKIEEREAGKEVALSPMPKPKPVPSQPSSLEAKRSRRLIEQLKKLEPNAMTPMEALMKLEELKRLLS